MKRLEEIIDRNTEGNYLFSSTDKAQMMSEILDLFSDSESFTSKMWRIDTKAALGDDITEEEKQFFNDNLDKMKTKTSDDADHWEYHASKM